MSRANKQSSSSPQIVINDDYYEVQQILDRRPSPNGMLYLIKWVNYPNPKDYTWEPLQNLTDVKTLVEQFELQFQQKEREKARSKPVQKPIQTRRIKKDQQQQQQQQQGQQLENAKPTNKRGRKPLDRSKTKKLVKNSKQKKVKQLNSQSQEQQQSDEEKLNNQRQKQQAIRTFQPNIQQFVARKKNNTKRQGNSKNKKEVFYESDQFRLGRIYSHFEEEGQLQFNVTILNLKGETCAVITLGWDDLIQKYEQKLQVYLEDYTLRCARSELNQQKKQTKEFQSYWKSVS